MTRSIITLLSPLDGMLIYPKGTPPTAFHQTSQTVCQLQLDIPRIPKKDLSPSKFLHNLDKSSLISTQHIRPFSVVQEGSYKVRKKGMQTNLTDFFSSFRKVFSRLFFKTRIRGKGILFYQNQLSQICIARVINQSLRTIQ